MNPADLAAVLRQSLADHKLSGGEKTALARWLAANVTTDHERGVARHEVFAAAKAAAATSDPGAVIDWVEDVLKVLLPVMPAAAPPQAAKEKAEAFFSPGDACRLHIAHRFASARQTADVCVFTVTDDRITRAILDCHRRGVRVRIITDNEKAFDPGSDVGRLREAGVPALVAAFAGAFEALWGRLT